MFGESRWRALLALVVVISVSGCNADDTDDTGDSDQQYQGARSVGPDAGWRIVRPRWTDSDTAAQEAEE